MSSIINKMSPSTAIVSQPNESAGSSKVTYSEKASFRPLVKRLPNLKPPKKRPPNLSTGCRPLTDPAPIPSNHTSDATKRIINHCGYYADGLLCCLSEILPKKKRPIIEVIRSLVAQLHFILVGRLMKKFRSQDFSDITAEHGTMKSGVRFIRELMGLLDVEKARFLVIIDDFHYLYGSQSDHEDEVWEDLFKALHCHKDCDPNESKARVKVFIRSSGSEDVLHKLGYSGVMVGADNSSGNYSYDDLVEVIRKR